MLTKPDPTRIEIEHPLVGLIESCERHCVSDCCGIDAFDFSPLFIAAYLSTHYGEIRAEDVESLRNQLHTIRKDYCSEPLQDIEYALEIERMNQLFTTAGLARLLNEIEYNLGQAAPVLELSDSLRKTEAEQGGGGQAATRTEST